MAGNACRWSGRKNYAILHYAILHNTLLAYHDERTEQPICHWEICEQGILL